MIFQKAHARASRNRCKVVPNIPGGQSDNLELHTILYPQPIGEPAFIGLGNDKLRIVKTINTIYRLERCPLRVGGFFTPELILPTADLRKTYSCSLTGKCKHGCNNALEDLAFSSVPNILGKTIYD
jgi:hypothetical protein